MAESDGGVSGETFKAAIKDRLKTTHVEVKDNSGGCGQVLEAIIVSPDFTGKNTLARNRTVNKLLAGEIAEVHAWTQKCYTPEEWEKVRPKEGE